MAIPTLFSFLFSCVDITVYSLFLSLGPDSIELKFLFTCFCEILGRGWFVWFVGVFILYLPLKNVGEFTFEVSTLLSPYFDFLFDLIIPTLKLLLTCISDYLSSSSLFKSSPRSWFGFFLKLSKRRIFLNYSLSGPVLFKKWWGWESLA